MGVFLLCNVKFWTKWASWPILLHLLVLGNTAENSLDAEISWREGRAILCRAVLCAVHRSHPGARVPPAWAAHTSHSSILPSHSTGPADKPGLDLPAALCPKNLPVAGTSGANFRPEPRMRQDLCPASVARAFGHPRHSTVRDITHWMGIELWIS